LNISSPRFGDVYSYSASVDLPSVSLPAAFFHLLLTFCFASFFDLSPAQATFRDFKIGRNSVIRLLRVFSIVFKPLPRFSKFFKLLSLSATFSGFRIRFAQFVSFRSSSFIGLSSLFSTVFGDLQATGTESIWNSTSATVSEIPIKCRNKLEKTI
jgi:hypothetical protein